MERLINLLRTLLVGLVYTSVLYRYFWSGDITASFIRRISMLVVIWLYGTVIFYHYLRQSDRISRIYKYVTTSLDVGLLTACLLMTATSDTSLVAAYYLIIAFSSARFSWSITIYSGLISTVSYFSLYQFLFPTVFKDTTTLIYSLSMIFTAVTVAFATRRKDSLLIDVALARHEHRKVKDILVRYVSDTVAERVISQESSDEFLREGRKDVTIVMADIRGFTQLSENMTPENVVQMLNDYFSIMVDIIFKHEGTLDKFMGDGVLVLFGAPIHEKNHVAKGLATALEMQSKLQDFNTRSEQWPSLQMGIGISTGEVVVGEIGSHERKDYTAIGRAVNLAERLEAIADPGEILLSTKVADSVDQKIQTEQIKQVNLDGFDQSKTAYRIKDPRQSLTVNELT